MKTVVGILTAFLFVLCTGILSNRDLMASTAHTMDRFDFLHQAQLLCLRSGFPWPTVEYKGRPVVREARFWDTAYCRSTLTHTSIVSWLFELGCVVRGSRQGKEELVVECPHNEFGVPYELTHRE